MERDMLELRSIIKLFDKYGGCSSEAFYLQIKKDQKRTLQMNDWHLLDQFLKNFLGTFSCSEKRLREFLKKIYKGLDLKKKSLGINIIWLKASSTPDRASYFNPQFNNSLKKQLNPKPPPKLSYSQHQQQIPRMQGFQLTSEQRNTMNTVFQISKDRHQHMLRKEQHMHQQFDHILEQVIHTCTSCKLQFKGKQFEAHYRNQKRCKYMRDRPWLKKLPDNWKQDLELFQQQQHLHDIV